MTTTTNPAAAGCQGAWYCGRACQKVDQKAGWRGYKKACRAAGVVAGGGGKVGKAKGGKVGARNRGTQGQAHAPWPCMGT